ncbi:MAG TPA: endonuclease/exonuclease/phosphatase family protein [Gemmataceae bacterium]|nr:endonuclease/exonuclease/phosphatase family protein [Gemmataceae bacterium]
MRFRAITYNILATAYIKPAWYAGVAADLLRPELRVPAAVEHIEGLHADLLCLQEVEAETFTTLNRRLKPLGYAGRYERQGQGKPDGCAVFFREGLFTLREVQRRDYHDVERGPAGDSGHIALLLCLEHEGRLLGVANTHLRWDKPGTPRTQQIGYRQILELLEACERFTPPCEGWLVCGDFNCPAHSEVVAAMSRAGYVYAHARCPGVRSCVVNGKAKLIDYLFHTAALQSRPFDPPPVVDGQPLPSQEQPSDHLALVADFAWA